MEGAVYRQKSGIWTTDEAGLMKKSKNKKRIHQTKTFTQQISQQKEHKTYHVEKIFANHIIL